MVVCSGTRLRFKERDPLRAFLLKPVGCGNLLKIVGDLITLADSLREQEESAAAAQSPVPPAAAPPGQPGSNIQPAAFDPSSLDEDLD